jgi:hypothetical protein
MAKSAAKKPAKKVGRPSLYSDRIAQQICELIAEGESLRSICERHGFPSRTVVRDWLVTREDFRAKYARAREEQADVMDEKILDVADSCTPETAQADRVKIAAYQWRAAKLKPKVYGDKVMSEISGPDGAPIETLAMTPDEAARKAAFMLAKGLKATKRKT